MDFSGKQKVIHFEAISPLSCRYLLEITQTAHGIHDYTTDCSASRLRSRRIWDHK